MVPYSAIKLVCPKCGSAKLRIPSDPQQNEAFECIDCKSISQSADFLPQVEVGKTANRHYNLSSHPDHAAALGELVSAWSSVEQSLCIVMSFLLRAPPWHTQTAYYAILNNNARIDVIRALGTHMIGQDKFQGTLNELLDTAKTLANARNGLVHKKWSTSRDLKDVYALENIGSPGTSQRRKVHAKEMREISEKIMDLASDLDEFAGEYSAAHPLSIDEIPSALRRKFSQLFDSHNPDSGPRPKSK
jgi:hypothetical protein